MPGHPGVFAVGDVAATDPLRSSAGSHPVLGRTLPIAHSTASAAAGGCPVLHCTPG
ncbi:hypothetical protein JHV666_49830 [Mycobacterium avium subsp. hominissuis]